jgi:hypothetical protein
VWFGLMQLNKLGQLNAAIARKNNDRRGGLRVDRPHPGHKVVEN